MKAYMNRQRQINEYVIFRALKESWYPEIIIFKFINSMNKSALYLYIDKIILKLPDIFLKFVYLMFHFKRTL